MLRFLVPLALLVSCAAQSASPSCRQVVLVGAISSGDPYEKIIGQDLVFRLNPWKADPKSGGNGWDISLTPAQARNDDYIYPVNPPLRFNGLQMLGASYGDDTKTSLGHAHQMRLILNAADYKRIQPLLSNALWPYSAPNPDAAADEYVTALKRVTTGKLVLTVTSYGADAGTGFIRRFEFRVVLTAPEAFSFETALKPRPAECPPAEE